MDAKQKGVVRGAGTAAAVTIIAILGTAYWQPFPELAMKDGPQRLVFALKADLFVAIWLAVGVMRLANYRFFSPEDIDGSGLTTATERAWIYQSVLQNTLEQVVLAVPVHLVWAATMPARWLICVPTAVALFSLGRVLFWRGYRGGAPARAIGFGLTFYPTVLMSMILVVVILIEIVTS